MAIPNKFRFDNTFGDIPHVIKDLRIYQLGDLYCEKDTYIGEHLQYCFELSFVDSGKGLFYSENDFQELTAGDIHFSFIGERHKIVPDKKELLRYFYFSFDYTDSQYAGIMDEIRRHFKNTQNRKINAPALFGFVRTILFEFYSKKDFSEELVLLAAKQLLINLYRTVCNQAENSSFYVIDTKKELISSIMRYIDNNIADIKNVNSIAEKFSFDRSYLSKLFKKTLGETIQNYLTRKKFEFSKILISQKNCSVTEAAEQLNYASIHSFSRAFKAYYNMSPNEFKESVLSLSE